MSTIATTRPSTTGTETTDDPTVRCRAHECTTPAAWVLVLRCCITRPTYLCSKHALKLRSALHGLTNRPVICVYCQRTPELTYEERLT